jgi:flavin-dependent dehydrogenase
MKKESSFTDVIVIGAGIAGLATAWNYKKKETGHSVRIIDRVP